MTLEVNLQKEKKDLEELQIKFKENLGVKVKDAVNHMEQKVLFINILNLNILNFMKSWKKSGLLNQYQILVFQTLKNFNNKKIEQNVSFNLIFLNSCIYLDNFNTFSFNAIFTEK